MDTSEVRSLVEELQSVSLDMDADVLPKVNRCVEIIEDMSAHQCRSVIDMAGSRPLLLTFMSDGWSTDIRSRVLTAHEGVTVRSRTRLREEFLMQRTVLKTNVGGDPHMSIKLERCRQLASKKCIDMYAGLAATSLSSNSLAIKASACQCICRTVCSLSLLDT